MSRLMDADKLVKLGYGEVCNQLTSGKADYDPEQVVDAVESLLEEYEVSLPPEGYRQLHKIIRNGGVE